MKEENEQNQLQYSAIAQRQADQRMRNNWMAIQKKENPTETNYSNHTNWASPIQKQSANPNSVTSKNSSPSSNKTGLPDNLKSGIENLSGHSMDDVKVHYNSDKPAQLQAYAFAQGTDIHLSSGQEKHLPHEAWHVVQQKQGRVTPTTQMKGKVNINDDAGLEREADIMGAKAMQFKGTGNDASDRVASAYTTDTIQRFEAPKHESAGRMALTEDGAFSQEEATAIYYGNWMRDVNQAFVPSLIDKVGVDMVYAGLTVMSYQKFGKMPTQEQLGIYIPAEHLDSPAGAVAGSEYFEGGKIDKVSEDLESQTAVNPEKASPVETPFKTLQHGTEPSSTKIFNNDSNNDNSKLFDVDQSGVMAYMHRSFEHLENRLTLAAKKGRTEEGMLHYGAAMHVTEDLFAHSNYVEIAVEKILKEQNYNHETGRMEHTYLPELPKEHRDIQTFSKDVMVEDQQQMMTAPRPVLTTGSFSSADTMQSVGHEMLHFLKKEPKKGTSENLEQKIAFNIAMGRYLDKNTSATQVVLEIINKNLAQNNIPAEDIENITSQYISFEAIMKGLGNLSLLLSNDTINNILHSIDLVIHSEIKTPLAAQIESMTMDESVRDTSLLNTYEADKKTARGEKDNSLMSQGMQKIDEQIYSPEKIKNKQEGSLKTAQARVDALEKTPVSVVAGPSHTQISKDHGNSVFFGLAFQLAVKANKMIRDEMLNIWSKNQLDLGTPKSKEPEEPSMFDNFITGSKDLMTEHLGVEFDEKPKEKKLSNEELIAKTHQEHASKSFDFARQVMEQGYDPENIPNLNAHDKESAAQLIAFAQFLDNINQLDDKSRLGLDHIEEFFQEDSGLEWEPIHIQELENIANNLRGTAQSLGNDDMRTYESREGLYNQLKEQRTQLGKELLDPQYLENPESITGIKLDQQKQCIAIITAMDRIISGIAPSYSKQQKEILSGDQNIMTRNNQKWAKLQQTHIEKPSASRHGGTYENLINKAREVTSHPYDVSWWEETVKSYMEKHKELIKESIIARNIGIATFRTDKQHKH
ncbi:HET-C-related protein [Aureibacter tunicatorum]|uniref:eCIS core domain-containing protein n=1 Tax=Aureibacter tunicatorum TaxID=866807 RepID=A0AAE4BQE5_9BACT|nr:HET-C-related protein [Aureibacter tunicatorum]MDR6237461.1 hypothetical protein [Aureibacter tunicatorum]BDD06450.1 hypothetical protein AUTU_39330 [Aureibacter tunicatorum]